MQVKIEPMIVAGCVFCRVSRCCFQSACDTMQGGCKGLVPPLHCRGTLLVCLWIVAFSWSLWIISQGYAVFIDSSRSYPIIICCCFCNSWWIQADPSGLISICLANPYQFKLIIADQFARLQQIKSPALPSLQNFQSFSKYEGSGEYFSIDLVQFDGASWQLLAWMAPTHLVAMDTSLPLPEVLRPPANL